MCLPILLQISHQHFKVHFTKGIEALLKRTRKWKGDWRRRRNKEVKETEEKKKEVKATLLN